MGFLSDLGNAFMGKPLQPPVDDKAPADQPQEQSTEPAQTLEQQQGVHDERGFKIIPKIDFKDLRSQRQGTDRLIVKAWVLNDSDQLIRIDTSYVLKQKRTHNQQINPRDSREITLYEGEIPDNDNENSAQIAYRLQVNGDVFMENYRVDYYRESDGKFVVSNLIDDGPVRDI